MYTGLQVELACQYRTDALKAATERRLVREIRQAKKGKITPTLGLVLWFREVLHQAHLPLIRPQNASLTQDQPTAR